MINRKTRIALFASTLLTALISCQEDNNYFETSYQAFFQVSSFSVFNMTVYLDDCITSEEFDAASRVFYNEADTSLSFKLRRPTNAHPERGIIAAIDWRITSINVTTLEDFDKDHPAGSSMNDIVSFEYEYKNQRFSIPLSEIKFGSVMLVDFYPAATDWRLPILRLNHEGMQMPRIDVRIEDAFGRTLTAQSKQSD